jgi:hypothetical protein
MEIEMLKNLESSTTDAVKKHFYSQNLNLASRTITKITLLLAKLAAHHLIFDKTRP